MTAPAPCRVFREAIQRAATYGIGTYVAHADGTATLVDIMTEPLPAPPTWRTDHPPAAVTAARLRVLLRALGWTHAQAADAFHVSRPMITYATSGRARTPDHILAWLEARALAVEAPDEAPGWKSPHTPIT